MTGEAKLAVEYLTTTTLGEKGQLTVPKEFRDALTLRVGAPIAVLRIGNGLMLIPEHARFRALCDRIAGIFSRRSVQTKQLIASLPRARRRVYERHYPSLSKPGRKRSPARRR
jgi:AbrB family looped-hinge helix DNA binding protein